MASSKTLTPTNVTISIPAMTDRPDASVFSNCVDKEADAINTLKTTGDSHDAIVGKDTKGTKSSSLEHTFTFPNSSRAILIVTGNGSVERFWIGYIYCTASGGVRIQEINAGGRATASVPDNTTNQLMITLDQAQAVAFRTVSILGDAVT